SLYGIFVNMEILDSNSRRAIRKYLKHRQYNCQPLWVTHPRFGSERLTYSGLLVVISRRSSDAKIAIPQIHDFRCTFWIIMLRNGVDILPLAKLMGHESIDVLKRYLKQTTKDTEAAHRRASQVDRWGL
ncbi:tyrosine-type recombinase/integrase, partial [Chloroflexota bacterium]